MIPVYGTYICWKEKNKVFSAYFDKTALIQNPGTDLRKWWGVFFLVVRILKLQQYEIDKDLVAPDINKSVDKFLYYPELQNYIIWR